MAKSRKSATPTSAATVATVASATLLLLLVVVLVVLVCCGTSGSGAGELRNPYLPPRGKHGGGGGDGDGNAVVPPPHSPPRWHLEGRTDEPRPTASSSSFSSSAFAASASASASAARAWAPAGDDGEGPGGALVEAAATGGTVSAGTPSGRAGGERAEGRGGLASDTGQGGLASVLYGALPANASRVPHTDAAAEEAGAGWAGRNGYTRGRGGVEEAEGGGIRGGGEVRLRGVQSWWRSTRLAVWGEEQGDGGGHGGGGALADRSMRAKPERCFVPEGREGRTRCHANIFFFGVSKCGTTSLAHWMSAHPELRWVTRSDQTGKPGSEAHVFEMSKSEVDELYPLTAPEAEEADPVMDYTPHYSIVANVPYRIVRLYGEHTYDGAVKYIVLLREPAARTISSWQFKYDLHGAMEGSSSEQRTLEQVFAEGRKRVENLLGCLSKHLEGGGSFLNSGQRKADLDTCNPKRFLERNDYLSHVGKSVYVLQLQRWMSIVGKHNVKVVFLEEMAANPVETLSSVLAFVGMDLVDGDSEGGTKGLPSRKEWEKIVRRSHNPTDEEKKKVLGPQATPELVQAMRDYFAPFNAKLEELLGRPLPENWSLPPGRRV